MKYIVEQKKVSDNIAIALRKMNGNVTAGALRGATGDLLQLIFNDQAFFSFSRSLDHHPIGKNSKMKSLQWSSNWACQHGS